MHYYLGIDNGGTATKAAIYNEHGAEIAVASASTQVICPHPGWAERDMNEMWQTNCRVIRSALEQSGLSPDQIVGIACCGHGKGLYLIGPDGEPVRNAILSADNRALEYEKMWKRDGTEAKAYSRSLQHVMACQPVALLAWLRDHKPETLARIRWLLPCKDYVRYRLTGTAMAELSDMSGTGLMNLDTRAYDPALLELFGIGFIGEALPPLCHCLQRCGTVSKQAAMETGLAEGTAVFGGMFDINACALAVGVHEPESLCMVSGTWSINEFVCAKPVLSDAVQMNSLFCLGGHFLVEESSATSAGNNEWFLRKILRAKAEGEKSIYDLANEAVESLDPAEPLPIYLPFVMASNADPDATGAFVGLTQSMDARHMIRAVYEGVAFSHRWHFEKLLPSRTKPLAEIRLSGGAARSTVWTQMFADVLGYPIRSVNARETGALGCAISAAAALGDHPSVTKAIEAMVCLSDAVYPDRSKKDYYEYRYRLYCDVIRSLEPVWSHFK